MNETRIVSTADLKKLIDEETDFPLAQLAAMQLWPAYKQAEAELVSQGGRHADALKGSGNVTESITNVVGTAVVELQKHMFELQRLAIEHPDQRDDILKQVDHTRKVAGTLTQALSMTMDLNNKTHDRSTPRTK